MRSVLLCLLLVGCADEPTATEHFQDLERSTMRECGILRPNVACNDADRAKFEAAIACINEAATANVVAALDAYEPQMSGGAFAKYYFAEDGVVVMFSSYDDFASGESSLNEYRCTGLALVDDSTQAGCSRISCLD
jgi:hypothetical protein